MTTPDTFSASIRASCSLSAMQLGKLWAQSMTRQLVKDKSKPELMPRGHAWGGGGAGGVEIVIGVCVWSRIASVLRRSHISFLVEGGAVTR